MTQSPIAQFLTFAVLYPPAAFLPFFFGLSAGAQVAFGTGPGTPPAVLLLVIAAAGAFAAIPAIALGRAATRNWWIAVGPAAITTAALVLWAIGLMLQLGRLLPRDMITALMGLGMLYLLACAVPYVMGLGRMWRHMRRAYAGR
ncbi:MAG: hypothetical protein AAFY65_00970 [Pseudomonadota bacterium]